MAGHVSSLSHLLDDSLDVRDHRALMEALGGAIPDDMQAYVVNKTNDDFSREIRRHRDHFEVPGKPDTSKFELVRAVLKALE